MELPDIWRKSTCLFLETLSIPVTLIKSTKFVEKNQTLLAFGSKASFFQHTNNGNLDVSCIEKSATCQNQKTITFKEISVEMLDSSIPMRSGILYELKSRHSVVDATPCLHDRQHR